jgi:hypothetical protein
MGLPACCAKRWDASGAIKTRTEEPSAGAGSSMGT